MPTITKPKKEAPRRKGSFGTLWKDSMLVDAYDLAKSGLTNANIAKALGVEPCVFYYWVNRKPILREALVKARGRGQQRAVETFLTYIYKQLPPNLKRLWKEINECTESTNSIRKVESLLEQAGLRARQHLFLYALVDSNFQASEALRKVRVSYLTLKNWIEKEPEFAQLMDEIHWHKKNFMEGALMQLVEERVPSVVIFANKTQNADRGYNAKVDINVGGRIDHAHAHMHLSVDDLGLDLDTRRKILEAMQKKKGIEGRVVNGQAKLLTNEPEELRIADDVAREIEQVISN